VVGLSNLGGVLLVHGATVALEPGVAEADNVTSADFVIDGTPFGLVQHLLNPLSDALLPVGTRGYGAAVYSNPASEIRVPSWI
jgi:hypothetical protein